ncbi:type IV pili methyl-accepting chemotaxis transducer N-terminal domain-containing protein [Pseudorhodoferax sp.]|uniref:type IV pili methyl-accepting chemotaxis transducer N-terminal domain-containing protein n=1 Tax=Pseudorhodoferax sp. TaxID=1993553 RepID=UPI0039E4E227
MARPERGARRTPLAAKIGAIGCLLLALALAAIGLTLWVTWQLEGGGAAVNEAGRMRMQTWRMAQTLSAGDIARLPSQLVQFDASLEMLQYGDPVRALAVPRDQASRQALARVVQHWQALRAEWLAQAGSGAAGQPAAQAEAFVAAIDGLVDAIERQLARSTALLNTAQLAMMALAIAAALALLYAAQLLVLTPLGRLQHGLARLEAGDLSTRLDTHGSEEFAALAEGFNRMAARLQDLYASLERRVQEKTVRLEAEHARLAALYEAAAFAARAGSLEVLAQGFAVQLRQAARADACAVRWSDEANRRYVLLGADRLPPELVEAEHCVPTGECYCGQPQGDAHTRVFSLRELRPAPAASQVDPVQCRRARFASVVSVPVRLHERMVGEIDLFYRTDAALAEDDRALLDALASHLAGAMEALRADALQREAAVADERGLLARELHDSIAQSLAFLKIQAGLLRDELSRAPAPPGEGVRRTLAELDAGIRESLSDVRELLLHFRTRTNGEDIAPALRTTLNKFEHQTGLPATLSIDGEGLALPPDVQVQVLHVVQEALSNVRKHARASHVWVRVQQSPRWVVEVRDDGCGMDPAALAPDETHVGLRIMRERAAGIGATLDIATAPGAGTRVTLSLPRLQPAAWPEPAATA